MQGLLNNYKDFGFTLSEKRRNWSTFIQYSGYSVDKRLQESQAKVQNSRVTQVGDDGSPDEMVTIIGEGMNSRYILKGDPNVFMLWI